MKVLFSSYHHVGLGQGGMYFQILQTKRALEQLGIEVIEHSFMRTDLTDINICHIFATHSSNHTLINLCKNNNIPVVMSTVFNSFSKSKFRIFAERTFMRLPGISSELRSLEHTLNNIDQVFALNHEEKALLRSYFPKLNPERVKILPNGLDLEFSGSVPTKQNDTVLCVGQVCQRKNQLNLIKAAQGANWKLDIVGGLDNSKYSMACVKESQGHPNIKLHGSLNYGCDQLLTLYKSSKVFCLPSFSEVQPLTLIEAAQNNCNIVVSSKFPIQDFLRGEADFFNPNSIEEIKCAIESSLLKHGNLLEIMSRQPSWGDIASNLINSYSNLVKFYEE